MMPDMVEDSMENVPEGESNMRRDGCMRGCARTLKASAGAVWGCLCGDVRTGQSVQRLAVVLTMVAAICGPLCLGWREAIAGDQDDAAPVYPVEIVYTLPHDTNSFTQGLFFHDGRLYESTGLRGRSRVAELDPETGKILRRSFLEPYVFGEGSAAVDGRLFVLTWTSGRALVLDIEDFSRQGKFRYEGEGWGLAFDGEHLLMSDGSDTITLRDPGDFCPVGSFVVRDGGVPVARLNELEYVQGILYANVWQTPHVIAIDPDDGSVLRRLDLSPLYPPGFSSRKVANGIAWDASRSCLLVTGKLWSEMYCVRRAGFSGMP